MDDLVHARHVVDVFVARFGHAANQFDEPRAGPVRIPGNLEASAGDRAVRVQRGAAQIHQSVITTDPVVGGEPGAPRLPVRDHALPGAAGDRRHQLRVGRKVVAADVPEISLPVRFGRPRRDVERFARAPRRAAVGRAGEHDPRASAGTARQRRTRGGIRALLEHRGERSVRPDGGRRERVGAGRDVQLGRPQRRNAGRVDFDVALIERPERRIPENRLRLGPVPGRDAWRHRSSGWIRRRARTH